MAGSLLMSCQDMMYARTVLIESIIEKARRRKGLSHRDASVLLECDIPELNEEIYKLANEIKQDFYGNRLAPLRPVNTKVIVPSAREQEENPRSRSAKLRIAEKITD